MFEWLRPGKRASLEVDDVEHEGRRVISVETDRESGLWSLLPLLRVGCAFHRWRVVSIFALATALCSFATVNALKYQSRGNGRELELSTVEEHRQILMIAEWDLPLTDLRPEMLPKLRLLWDLVESGRLVGNENSRRSARRSLMVRMIMFDREELASFFGPLESDLDDNIAEMAKEWERRRVFNNKASQKSQGW